MFFLIASNQRVNKMIELKADMEPELAREIYLDQVPLFLHSSYYEVCEKLHKWIARFPQSTDNSIYSDLFLFYLIASRKYLDHRNSAHLFRVVLATNLMQKKLLRKTTLLPNERHLEVRLVSIALQFPFSSKPVLGCLIGFNVMDRYELFDEENIVLALQKHLPIPHLRLVKESSYHHTSQHKNLKIFYFEIEKKDATPFSLNEKILLNDYLTQKVSNSIQKLSPSIYMGLNEEEVYKNILVLSQEIQSQEDIPQACIHLDQQTGTEIVFRITLVHISPFHRFSLKDCFYNTKFVSEKIITVRHIDSHPIEAHIFQIHLPRDSSLLRSDGSLNYYIARQKVAALITAAIGEFRDYNGGIIIKQQELLQDFKERFPGITQDDHELLETFFYALTPLEKQAVLHQDILETLFKYFLETYRQKISKNSSYKIKTFRKDDQVYLFVQAEGSSLEETLLNLLKEETFSHLDIAYNFINYSGKTFFSCVFPEAEAEDVDTFINSVSQTLHQWQEKRKNQQVLRIGFEYSIFSLDPRIGGESVSGELIRLLFEGLTRFNLNGQVENAVAETIQISPDLKSYTFKLRSTTWNDGSPVSAYDFEYAWKKILSPDFKTTFAYLFFPIKNAEEAKEGKVSADDIGIHVLDDRTLKVELVSPTPYFLQLTAHPLYSPVHRHIDQQHPQWSYQCEHNYPCNGPFQLKLNQPSQGFQLIKNPLYWENNQIVLDQVIFSHLSPTQAMQAFQNNEVDWVGNPFGGWQSFYKPEENERILSFTNSLVCWCAMSLNYPPLKNIKLRQAFAYAVQRAKIVSEAFLPINPAFSIHLPNKNEQRGCSFPDFDPDKARQLMDEALDELNMTKRDLAPLSLMFVEKGIREYTAKCLKEQFQECFGIKCELKAQTWNTMFKKLSKGNFQIALMHWQPWVDDPIYTLYSFKSRNQEINFTKWQHPQFKEFIELGEHEVSPFQRSTYLLNAEKILCEEVPVFPLFYQPNQALIKKDLQVTYRTPTGPFNLARGYYKIKER
jgi:oligopeptide transport system substrate-binding protein